MMFLQPNVALLAFFQGTQLSLFERFLTQAISGINSTSITSGMQNAAYVVLLVGFLWQMYQSALHGEDVRGLGTNLVKYVVTAVIVMNYSAIFTAVNTGFVNAGNWVSNASGFGNLLDNWKTDLQTQFNQAGSQKLWGLVTGDIPGLIDALLIIVAYLLYPFVIAIFGFFYIFYGSILYIFGPIVIALMPLGATNRIAKAYVENLFIWNAWPILYGGFGALLGAVQMGQISQMLGQNNFLGGLGNLEGSILIGIASIIYSLAIAVIPFIAKRIVSGDVGSTAGALIGAAVTALTVGAAAVEGGVAGAAATGTGGTGSASGSAAATSTGKGGSEVTASGTNQPAPPQCIPRLGAPNPSDKAFGGFGSGPSIEGHAEQMRSSLSDALGGNDTNGETEGAAVAAVPGDGTVSAGVRGSSSNTSGGGRSSLPARRGPTVHRYNIGTWGTYHAARLVARTVTNAAGTKDSDGKN
jgi:TrbL/VirB6 plasmid conjugal transfer protein